MFVIRKISVPVSPPRSHKTPYSHRNSPTPQHEDQRLITTTGLKPGWQKQSSVFSDLPTQGRSTLKINHKRRNIEASWELVKRSPAIRSLFISLVQDYNSYSNRKFSIVSTDCLCLCIHVIWIDLYRIWAVFSHFLSWFPTFRIVNYNIWWKHCLLWLLTLMNLIFIFGIFFICI